jgi:hypothetical protein
MARLLFIRGSGIMPQRSIWTRQIKVNRPPAFGQVPESLEKHIADQ